MKLQVTFVAVLLMCCGAVCADAECIKNIEASSAIVGYPSNNAIDGDIHTTWACKNDSSEQWLKIYFNKKVRLYGLYIASGYLKNKTVYKNNNRLKHIRLTIDDQHRAEQPQREIGNQCVLDVKEFVDYRMTITQYMKTQVDDYFMQFESKDEHERGYNDYLQRVDNSVNLLFYPVVFKNSITCDAITIVIADTFVGEKYNEICISEIYPICEDEKYSDPILNAIRDIGNIVDRISNNDESILIASTREADETAEQNNLREFSIDQSQAVQYLIDSNQSHLIVWNGFAEDRGDAISDTYYRCLFFKRIDKQWRLASIWDVPFDSKQRYMPFYRNVEKELPSNFLSLYDWQGESRSSMPVRIYSK